MCPSTAPKLMVLMPTHRPTFSELWYRVADLRPRLHPTVQTYRQAFRGRTYHVVRDASNNQFFRLDDAGHHFVAMLDGHRTVGRVWEICNEQLGDRAPTQGEAIQLLGQLYAANLLQVDLTPDAQSMFERYRRRRQREVGSFFMNLLFVKIPLFDPDHILNAWLPAVRWVFSWIGLVLWLGLMAAGAYALVGRWDELIGHASSVLAPSNLLLLSIAFWIIKGLHEFGHGFACKAYGKDTGTGGEVHTMGIMLLVLMPVPYVDASSASAFRSKWQKAVVGAGGMFVELAVAAIAAIIWAQTSASGSTLVSAVHTLAYNIIFIASVSTLLFNGNPLLRYDGYYVLSDLLEMPNLAQRGREYVYYLVKRYLFGVEHAKSSARTRGERSWFFFYAVASMLYRVWISIHIFLFVASQLFFIGILLACGAAIGWVVVPTVKFFRYLLADAELGRVRPRAMGVTGAVVMILIIVIGLVPMPDRVRATGVVEPRHVKIVHMEVGGFMRQALPSGSHVEAGQTVLLTADNDELRMQHEELLAEIQRVRMEHRHAVGKDESRARILIQQLATLTKRLRFVEDRIEALTVKSSITGRWISPEIDRYEGAYLPEGERVGLVASTDDLVVRVVADQTTGPRVGAELASGDPVEARLRARPDVAFIGRIERVLPAGEEILPSAALGYLGGGEIAIAQDDPRGTTAAEPFFEVVLRPDDDSWTGLQSGQRVVLRFTFEHRPWVVQWLRTLRQLFQKRFQI